MSDSSSIDGVLRYGGGTSSSAAAARANFAGAGVNGLSMCTTPIELLSNDGQDSVLHTATGFFWLRQGRPHLVTNYHVVAGRNPFTGELTSKNGFIPRRLRFFGTEVSVQDGVVNFKRKAWVLEFDEDFPTMMETPPSVDGQIVDLWAAPLMDGVVFGKDPARTGFQGAETISCFVNEHTGTKIVTRAGDDCFILGYPLKNYDGLMTPIGKRGSIASDTNLGVGERPIFLVDAAVTPAMSGSPIFRRATTMTAINRDIGAVEEFHVFDLIGFYAGRLESAKLAAVNIGYGWHGTLIDKVLEYYTYRTMDSSI